MGGTGLGRGVGPAQRPCTHPIEAAQVLDPVLVPVSVVVDDSVLLVHTAGLGGTHKPSGGRPGQAAQEVAAPRRRLQPSPTRPQYHHQAPGRAAHEVPPAPPHLKRVCPRRPTQACPSLPRGPLQLRPALHSTRRPVPPLPSQPLLLGQRGRGWECSEDLGHAVHSQGQARLDGGGRIKGLWMLGEPSPHQPGPQRTPLGVTDTRTHA